MIPFALMGQRHWPSGKSLPNSARFALMNNGITIIARSLGKVADHFTIEAFQIVNGCQTSHVLFEAANDKQHPLNEAVSVPLRLIVTQDEDVINAIIRATNRQTEVKGELFRSHKVAPQYKPARYHLLYAVRLLMNQGNQPQMNAHAMKTFCEQIAAVVWDPAKSDEVFTKAVAAMDEAASGKFSRDVIRTLPFTERVMKACGVIINAEAR